MGNARLNFRRVPTWGPFHFTFCLLWRVGCLPLIISISPSLNRRPSSGSWREWVCERGGALKQPGLAACDEAHLKWMEPHHRRCYMPSAPLLWRPVSSPCMHAGVLVGPGRERRAWRTAPARRLTGQDAGPYPWKRRRPKGGRSRWWKPPPSRPGPQRGVRAAAGLRPLPGPFLPEHCPSFTTHAARRGHQIPCLFWTLHPLWTHCFIISVE